MAARDDPGPTPSAAPAPGIRSRRGRRYWAAGLGVGILGTAIALGVMKQLSEPRLDPADYACLVDEEAMTSCRIAVDADGELHLRFEAAALDATLAYDGPLTSVDGRLTCALEGRFRDPTTDERGEAGSLVLSPSNDETWRGDWTYVDGTMVPFVLVPRSPGTTSSPGAPPPAELAGSPRGRLASIDDFRATTRGALGRKGQFDAARAFLSAESYLGRANELKATRVLCRSHRSLAQLIGQTLAADGYWRDNDAGGTALDDPACSTYVRECVASECCSRFRCGAPILDPKDTVKEILRVCTHIELSAARCDVTLVPYGAVWWLGEGVRLELSDGRDTMIASATRGLEKVTMALEGPP